LEFEALDLRLQPRRISLDFSCGALVRFGGGKFEQLTSIRETAGQEVESIDDLFQLGPLPAKFLGALGCIPDAGLL
jgi:hypothetical protein